MNFGLKIYSTLLSVHTYEIVKRFERRILPPPISQKKTFKRRIIYRDVAMHWAKIQENIHLMKIIRFG